MIIILLMHTGAIAVNSQTVPEDEYDRNYKLSLGESAKYIVKFYYYPNSGVDQSTPELRLKNGSVIDFSITNETIISLNLNNITNTENENSNMYHFSFFIDNLELPEINFTDDKFGSGGLFITKAFNNVSIVDKYIEDENERRLLDKNQNVTNIILREGDLIHSQYNSPYTSQNNSIYWKTGWMQKLSSFGYDENGEILYGQIIEKIEDGLIDSTANIDFEPILTIIALPIMGAAFIGGAKLASNLGKKNI